MNRRKLFALALVATIVLTVVSSVAIGAAVGAGAANESETTTAAPADSGGDGGSGGSGESDASKGEYTIDDLRSGGVHPDGSPASVRMLGEIGFAAIRWTPAGPFQSEWQYLEPGTRIDTSEITLYTTRFGRGIDEREVELVIVYWTQDTRAVTTENGVTTEQYAANQTVERKRVTLGSGFSQTQVELRDHFEQPVRVTMWVTDPRTDQPIDGVRWRFEQQTVASESPLKSIDSEGDMWAWVGTNVFATGVLGLLVGVVLANRMLKKTGCGPGYPPAAWGVAVAISVLLVTAVGYFQTALVLSHAPWLMGVSLALIGFISYLEAANSSVTWGLFERPVLDDARQTESGAIQDELFEEHVEHRMIRREDGKWVFPKIGVLPFLARYWAEPATLDQTHLKTRVTSKGDSKHTEKFLGDPGADELLKLESAHFGWNFSPWRGEERYEDEGFVEYFLRNLRGGFLLKIAMALGGGWIVGRDVFGYAPFGLAIGVVVVLALAAEARDGYAWFEPAPVHMKKSKGAFDMEQIDYSEAADLESAKQEAWDAKTETRKQVLDDNTDFESTITGQLINGIFGEKDAEERTKRDKTVVPDDD